ncbi:MAG: hypothetical protein ROO73_06250 [Roseivirga sp.]
MLAYNSLPPPQQKALLSVFSTLSKREQKRLQRLLRQLSPKEIEALQGLFDQTQGEGNDDGQWIRRMVEVLLRKKYNIHQVRKLIQALQKGESGSQVVTKFVTDLAECTPASVDEAPLAPSDTPVQGTAEDTHKRWEEKFEQCRLEPTQKERLRALLAAFKGHEETLLELIGESFDEKHFLQILANKPQEYQEKTLSYILVLCREDKALTKEIIKTCGKIDMCKGIGVLFRHPGAVKHLRTFGQELEKEWGKRKSQE